MPAPLQEPKEYVQDIVRTIWLDLWELKMKILKDPWKIFSRELTYKTWQWL